MKGNFPIAKLLLAVALLPLLTYRMVETDSRMLPSLLDGVWTTDAPQYSDAFLELSPTFVITVVGREQPARIQFVDKVSVVSKDSKMLLTVHSTDIAKRTEETLVLDFRPDNGGELRLGHQPQVWRRNMHR